MGLQCLSIHKEKKACKQSETILEKNFAKNYEKDTSDTWSISHSSK